MDSYHELPQLVKMLFAMVMVLTLMGGLALVLKKLGLSGHIQSRGTVKRLRVIESIPIDARRRLLLVQRDQVQHLVIVGPNNETVIETGIPAPDNSGHD